MAEKQTHGSKVGKYLGKMHTRAHHFRGKGFSFFRSFPPSGFLQNPQ